MHLKASQDELVQLCRDVLESANQAGYDFCGEQREWHLPRINRALQALTKLLPMQMGQAMELAEDPWGDKIC
jgi:hypothetical protein